MSDVKMHTFINMHTFILVEYVLVLLAGLLVYNCLYHSRYMVLLGLILLVL